MVIALLPLLPRPTIEHPAKFLAPAALLLAIVYWAYRCLSRDLSIPHGHMPIAAYLTVLTALVASGTIQLFRDGPSEGEILRLVGRLLFVTFVFTIATWLLERRLTVSMPYLSLFAGFSALSVIIVLVGVSGNPLLGDVSPPRSFGLGLYKTSGVPRSMSEFGIVSTAVLAYVLTFRSRFRPWVGWASLGLTLTAIFISQSRSTYLATLLVLAGHLIVTSRLRRVGVPLLLAISLSLPIVTGKWAPWFIETPAGQVLAPSGTLERNALSRDRINRQALSMMAERPDGVLMGFSKEEWIDYTSPFFFSGVGIHNHFLASIVRLGWLAGILYLGALFLPLLLLAFDSFRSREAQLLLLAQVGMLSCLHYYEGMFSPVAAFNLGALWACASRGFGTRAIPGGTLWRRRPSTI